MNSTDENIEHDTPTCPNCGGERTRPLDSEWATCFDCDKSWTMTQETREEIETP